MVKPNGRIETTIYYNALGNMERLDHEWIGGDVMEITMHPMCLSDSKFSALKWDKFPSEPGDQFEYGPFKLRTLEYFFYSDTILAVRDRGFITDLRYLWYRFGRLFDIAYHRIIVTLAVWNLADREAGIIPTWRNIHALRRLAEWERKRTEKRMNEMASRINEDLRRENASV
jgi:hypothetical protein